MSMEQPEQTATGPYATAALAYWRHGWSPLPLPAHAKAPVPVGWTGATGGTPSGPDVQAWTEDHPSGNIALRLPPDVIGIDVDQYDAKPGGLVLADLEDRLGPLPATWRSTSRDDGVSGIRLYRVTPGLRWPGGLGPGIDTIRHDHRYAVAWPSVHPNGGTYRWITPDGLTALGDIPAPDQLPALPHAWVQHFTGGELARPATGSADLDAAAVVTWLTTNGSGPACGYTENALRDAVTALHTTHEGGRHDAATAHALRIVRAGGNGHRGSADALHRLGRAFEAAVGHARAVDAREWARIVITAVDKVAFEPVADFDPCTDPFHGLLPPAQQAPRTTTPREGVVPTATQDDTHPATQEEADARERTSWWPRDLAAPLSGDVEPELPDILARTDGRHAFYAGRVNGIIGPSESGKTWLAFHAVAQAVTQGRRSTIIDFEDSEGGAVSRLLGLGLTPEQILEHVAYINPDEFMHPYSPSGLDLTEHLDTWNPDVIVVDGVNAAMSLQGLDLQSNKDSTVFAQTVLKPLARGGACIVYVDHTPKDKNNESAGGIGAQAKRAMTTGCILKVEVITQFGVGQNGKLRIHVDKDRLGQVRGASAPSRGSHWFGDATITSRSDGSIEVAVHPADGFNPDTGQTAPWRPTGYMEKVSAYLAEHPGAGRNEIIANVSGKDEHIKTALRILVEEGWVTVTKQGQKSLHTLALAFTEEAEMVGNTPENNWGPTGGPLGARPPVEEPGALGAQRGDVVPLTQAPGSVREEPAKGQPGARHPVGSYVYRSIAGKVEQVNLTTGEVAVEGEARR